MFPLRMVQQERGETGTSGQISTLPSAGVSSDGSFEMVRDEP